MKASQIGKEKILELHKSFIDLKPRLINYIGQKLNHGIKNGIINKGFYSIEGLLDDIYLTCFDDLEENPSAFNPKISLLKNTIDKLNQILKSGKILSGNIAVDKLLEQEIIDLREKFTTDADGDLIPEEELTDISYHLKDYNDKVLLMDNQTGEKVNEDMENIDTALLQNESFNKLGSLIKTIIELAVFGNLSYMEIAEVLNLNEDDIKFIIEQFKI